MNLTNYDLKYDFVDELYKSLIKNTEVRAFC